MSNYNFSYDDFDSMLNDASSGVDYNQLFDQQGLSDVFGSDDTNFDDNLANLGGGNVGSGYEGVNLGDSNFDDIDSIMNDKALGVGEFFDPSEPLRTPDGVDESFTKDLSDPDFERYIESLSPEFQAEQERLKKIVDDLNLRPGDEGVVAGKMPSGWQKTKDGRYVNIRDDGTADGIDQDGNSFALSESQVQDRIKSGDLNTYASGYYTATGGDKYAPGGGRPVTLKNGKTGTLKPGGKVIDNDTGKEIGTIKDVKGDGGGTKPGGGGTGSKDNMLNKLLPLIMMMAMMNQNKGGGGSSGAVIPSLSADRKQLPYGPVSGSTARPGAGGTTYFSPTTYTKKAAGGGMMYGDGGISSLGGYSDGGRLLRGPGDGVSDSIPATIGGKQPARLAEGEFVVPARIVSELGNGSTEAGANKLYAMMDRVQKARRKTKNVAADTKAHKYLPA